MAYDDVTQAGDVQNWAKSETVRERVKRELMPLVEETRQRRQKLNYDWLRYHKAWAKQHEFQGYLGRSNIYLPAAKKGVETLVANVVAATFPGDEFFAVEPDKEEFSAMATDVQALEQNRVEMAKVRMHAEAHYRQLFMKGNAPGRIHWRKKELTTAKRTRKVDTEAQLYGARENTTETLYDGPCFTPIPAEDFYAYPENVNTLEDAWLIFEDYTTTKRAIMLDAAKGKYVMSEADAAHGDPIPEKEAADQQRLSSQGIPAPQGGDTKNLTQFIDCSYVFCDFDPNAKSADEERSPIPFCFTVTRGGQVLSATEAKYMSPGAAHPYVLGRIGQVTGRLWGSGTVEDIYPLQLLLNDQTNQAMDIATWVLNPGIVSNPNVLMTAIKDFEPGFQVLATDINAAFKTFAPPQEMIQSSSILLTQTMSWLQDFLGAQPVLSGGSAPGRAFRTATGIGTAQKNAELPLQQVVRLQEIDVWQPMLRSFWNLDRSLAKDPVLVSAGGQGALQAARSVDPKQIVGDYRFRWNASTQLANVQVRGQQIMQAIQVLSSPAAINMLGQMGIRINLAPLITRLMRDVFGFRDTDRILVQGPPAQPQPGQSQPGALQNAPPRLPQPQAPNPLNGAQGQDQSGPFGGMRLEANDLAGAFGGLTGGDDFGSMEQ
jgi:hypothetical protein